MTHELKIWPEFFEAHRMGQKKFEVRKNDRYFELYDKLRLNEYDPETKQYTGRYCYCDVTFILTDDFPGVERGYVVLGTT